MKFGMACLRWFLLLAVGQSAPVLKKVISMLQSMKETGRLSLWIFIRDQHLFNIC
jgi:hypothetical protein